MCTHPHDPAGDVGWLYEADPVPEESYKDSLRWYNQLLAQDHPFTVGACLYQVGPGGDWVTFRGFYTNTAPFANQFLDSL